VYDVAGVRSKIVATLLLRTVSLSNTGVVPLVVVHAELGPGIEFVYHSAKSAAGAAITGAGLVTPTT
jgi:hypothetical protein